MLAAVIAAALATASPQAAASDSLLRVFVDCPNYVPGCDLDFLRIEVTWIDYVRDRETADIHALATALQTGGGGWEYTVALIGRGPWAGRADTLRFNSPGTAVYDEQRRTFANNLSLGLVRYAMSTAAAPRLTLTYRAPHAAARQAAARARDPWDYWVFRLSFNGSANGEKFGRFARQNGSVSANRVTDTWKLSFGANYSESASRFIYEQTDTLGNVLFADTATSYNKDYSSSASVVRSLGNHWSGRVRGEFSRSTRTNIRRRIQVGPALEYDIFPYRESTRRQLSLQLGVALTHFAYDDTTIYDKLRETRPTASASLSLDVTQPWGTASASAGRTVYLDNHRQNSGYISGYASLRLFRGFSFTVNGYYSSVHDQLYLPKGGATRDDVLLRRRALETNYSYYYSFGISYRFGSTNNNIVNPRFSNGGSFFFFD